MVLFKDDSIFAASKNRNVLELDKNLALIKKFKGRNLQPLTIDANENHLVVGYGDLQVKLFACYVAYVDVHSRKKFDNNGTYEKILVSNFEVPCSALTNITIGIRT